VTVADDQVTVDLGAKYDGIVLSGDLDSLDEVYRASLRVGDHVPVKVLRFSHQYQAYVASLKQGRDREDWLRAQRLVETEEVVQGEVTGWNRGGVLVRFGRLTGFVPNSHLWSVPPGLRGKQLQEAKDGLIGQTISLKVIDVNQRRRRLVLSERAAARRRRRELLQEIAEGDVRTGVVRNLVDFGAFVDLGGVDGLIHISELAWRYVNHPSEVLKVGEETQVLVLRVDRERARIGLSRKRLLTDPWLELVSSIIVGQFARGVVTRAEPFGTFVDIGNGVEGLIHSSELEKAGVTAAELAPGSAVTVSVKAINKDRRQIDLQLE
jgi:small subunit ribosomal protein S1